MKKFLLIPLLCCLGLTAWAEDDYRKVGNLWYFVSNDKSYAHVVASQDETSYQAGLEGALTIPANLTVAEVVVPVTEIRKNVFKDCTKITSVVINAEITQITEGCFRGCTALESINIPATVTTIGIHAFNGCSKLGTVTIPQGVTTINGSAFVNCSGMTEINIPSTVGTIEGDVFAGCSALTKVNFASLESLCAISFNRANSNPLMNSGAQLWINGEKQTNLVIPSVIATIKKYAFAGLKSVSSVDFSAANLPLTIEEDAFVNNSGYSQVIFKDAEQLCSIDYGNEKANPLYCAQHIYYQGNAQEVKLVNIPASSLRDGNIIRPYILTGANSVTRINIPTGATVIGAGAFKGCGNFEFVGFANENDFQGISWQDNDANPFANGKAKPLVNGAPLETLTLTADVSAYKYKNSTWLKGVTLQLGVTSIGEQAFMGCSNLASVTINGANLESIGKQAFHSCTKLGNVSLSTVTSIGEEAFRNCQKITEMTIPVGCTTLGDGIFVWCTQLQKVTIEANVDIPSLTFQNCVNLQKVVTTTTKNIGSNAFQGCSSLELVPVTTGLTTIGDNAFQNCSKLSNLMLSEGGALSTIGQNAFNGCSGITMVSFPVTLSEIKENAFAGCTSLTDVYCLKDEAPVPVIYASSFGGREASIKLHVSNTGIYTAADNWMNFLIYEAGEVTLTFVVNDQLFTEIKQAAGTRIEQSEPSVNVYSDDTTVETFSGWDKPFPEIMPGEVTIFYGYVTTTTTIDNYKYLLSPAEIDNGKNLQKRAELIGVVDNTITQSNSKVTVPLTVTNTKGNYNKEEFPVITIGANAFSGQGELAEIELTSNIETLGNAAFMGCGKLESVKGLAESKVTAFSDNLFQNCTSLSFDAIPANIKAIGYKALSNTGCTSVTIHSAIETMGNEVFNGCKNLETVTFAEGFQLALPELTFMNCSSLKNVTLQGTMGAIGIRAFEGCSALTDMVVPEGIDRVGRLSFNGCSKLQNISLPASLTQINEQAFKGCSSLSQIVVLASDVPTAYANAFEQTTYNNAKVYVNDVAKYKAAETWKNFGDNILTNQTYTLTYMVNGEQNGEVENLNVGARITPRAEPASINEGTDFKGWEGLPEVMPAQAVVATGKFKYQLSFAWADDKLEKALPDAMPLYYGDKVELPVDVLSMDDNKFTVTFQAAKKVGEEWQDIAVDQEDVETTEVLMPGKNVTAVVSYTPSDADFTEGNLKYRIVDMHKESKHAEVASGKDAAGEVVIPASVTYDNKEYAVTAIQDNAFEGNQKITGMVLPETIVSIGKRAFYDNRFTTITIPASVNSIGSEAFRYCTTMKTFNFAEGSAVTELAVGVFQECSSLENAVLPGQLKTIAGYVFNNCTQLKTVTLPVTLTSLGTSAFGGCTALEQINANPITAPAANSSNTFPAAIYSKAWLYVPEASTGYDQAPWLSFTNRGELKTYKLTYQYDDKEAQTKQIMVGAKIDLAIPVVEGHEFSGWQGLPEVMPAKNVEVTGKFKYKMSYSMDEESENKEFQLPAEEWIWYGDPIKLSDALSHQEYIYTTTGMPDTDVMPARDVNVVVKYTLSEQVYASDGINYKVVLLEVDGEPAHAEVMESPNKTGNVVIPDKITYTNGIEYPVTVIQDNAFNSNNSRLITGMTLPAGLKKIGARAFRDCRFTTLTIPATVESIGSQAFLYCTTMTTVTFAGTNLTELSDGAFQSCFSLENIQLPEGLLTIGTSAFAGCSRLNAISLPATLTEIRGYAFSGSNEIASVTVLSTTLPQADNTIFEAKVYENAVLTVPKGTDATAAEPWSLFANHQEGEESTATEKCKTPTISYDKGTLKFVSETPEAQMIYSISDTDMANNKQSASVNLVKKYNIKVYAKKPGMLWSDEATASITWHNGKPTFEGFKDVTLEDSNLLKGDVNEDGKVSISDAVTVVNIILNDPNAAAAPELEQEEAPEEGEESENDPE